MTNNLEDIAKRALAVAMGADDPLLVGAHSLCRKLLAVQQGLVEANNALAEVARIRRERENEVIGFGAQSSMLLEMLQEHIAQQQQQQQQTPPPVVHVEHVATVIEEEPTPPTMPNPWHDELVPREG